MKPKVVLDTNVVVSAFLKEHGKEALVLRLGLAGAFLLCVSEPVLLEYEAVLLRPKFRRPKRAVDAFMSDLRARALLVKAKLALDISRHEPDNRLYECAAAARADFLVTGNARHFPEGYKTTKIVNAGQLLEALMPHPTR